MSWFFNRIHTQYTAFPYVFFNLSNNLSDIFVYLNYLEPQMSERLFFVVYLYAQSSLRMPRAANHIFNTP